MIRIVNFYDILTRSTKNLSQKEVATELLVCEFCGSYNRKIDQVDYGEPWFFPAVPSSTHNPRKCQNFELFCFPVEEIEDHFLDKFLDIAISQEIPLIHLAKAALLGLASHPSRSP